MKNIKKITKTKGIIFTATAVLIVSLVFLFAFNILPIFNKDLSEKPNDSVDVSQGIVTTPYCELKYPSSWKEQITFRTFSDKNGLSYCFNAKIDQKEYELFTVYFGNSEKGNLFGYLPADKDDIPVYIYCNNLKDINNISETELSQLYAMMEGINDVAQSIANTTGYYETK